MLFRFAICALIVTMGVVTWREMRSHGPEAPRVTEVAALLGAIALTALGGFGLAWAIHVGATRGDYEYWVMMIDLAMIGQGALTVLYLWLRRVPRSV